MASKIVLECCKLLAAKKLKVAFAESATAGRLAAEFSLSPDSGEVLVGALVCYDACLKEDILKVPKELIEEYTPESAEVTEEIARRLPILMKADITVGITGLIAPGGSETPEKPVGTIFIHAIIQNESVGIREIFSGSPEEIVMQTVERTARLIIDFLVAS